MAVARRGGTSGSAANGSDVVISLTGLGLQQDDVVYVYGGHFNRAASSVGVSSAGWTSLINDVASNPFVSLDRKVMGATPDTSVTCRGTGNAADAAAYIVEAWSGVNTTTPEDVTTTTASGSSTNPDPAAITPTNNNCGILACAMSVVNDAAITAPTNYSNLNPANSNDTNAATAAIASRVLSGGGGASENPATYTGWATGAWKTATVALRPNINAFTLSADPGSYALTGGDAGLTAAKLFNAGPGAYTLTGFAAQVAAAKLFSADPGAYAWTGAANAMHYRNAASQLIFPALAGNYTLAPYAWDTPTYLWDGSQSWDVQGWPVSFDLVRMVLALPGSYAITGSDATMPRSLMMNAAAGSYALTGSDATMIRALLLNASAGAYVINGIAALLAKAYTMSADAGAYALTGFATTMLRGLVLVADPGAYVLTGFAATLARALLFNAGPGSYAITGIDANLAYGRVLIASPGAYAITGSAATMTRALLFSADPGAYVLTGQQAQLARSLLMDAQPGAYVLTGTDAAFLRLAVLAADPGGYVLSGADATLDYSAAPPPVNQDFAFRIFQGRRGSF